MYSQLVHALTAHVLKHSSEIRGTPPVLAMAIVDRVISALPEVFGSPADSSWETISLEQLVTTEWGMHINDRLYPADQLVCIDPENDVYVHRDETGTCRICGCTDEDCSACVARTGTVCSWVEHNVCSACADAELTRDVLALVDIDLDRLTLETIASWSPADRQLAIEWAGAVHLDASDNDVDVPPRPSFLDEYVMGPGFRLEPWMHDEGVAP
jgi:hypothetical protein